MNKKGQINIYVVTMLLFLLLIAIVLVYSIFYAVFYSDTTITIKDKWVDVQSNQGKYLIGSVDGEVFTIQDSLINMRFDSSTLFNQIEIGQICEIHASGWRIPFLSEYRNILTANCR